MDQVGEIRHALVNINAVLALCEVNLQLYFDARETHEFNQYMFSTFSELYDFGENFTIPEEVYAFLKEALDLKPKVTKQLVLGKKLICVPAVGTILT